MVSLKAVCLFLLSRRNTMTHILQAGNSSSVKACLVFLFHWVHTVHSVTLHSQTHLEYMRSQFLSALLSHLHSVTFPMFIIEGWWVLLISPASMRHFILDDRFGMMGWKSWAGPCCWEARLLFSTQALSNTVAESYDCFRCWNLSGGSLQGKVYPPWCIMVSSYELLLSTCVGSKITQTVSVVLLPFLKES